MARYPCELRRRGKKRGKKKEKKSKTEENQ
jgi:hypothetical protein